ncbi:MAG: phosphatidate cytidylyltransferase [Gallionellaceae bacterium]|nr:MAG: phosphatidate cytidylyltransferase [Gallionellaceae bacterium]
MLKQRVITAVILFMLLLAAIFALPSWGWSALVTLMIWQGAVEWARLSKMDGHVATWYCIATLLVTLAMWWFDAGLTGERVLLPHLFWYFAAIILWVLVVPAWMIAGWKPQNPWLLGLVGWVVLLPTGLAMIDLRNVSPWLLLGAMSVVWVADTAAYFSGKRFGKNKLAPAISPGKTWEGVFGALFVVTIYVLIAGWASGLFKSYPIFPGIIIASWWWVGLAVIGDLFESAVKRQAGVKDSGALLPGHGGLLDRIDALTSTLPFAAIALVFQEMSR